MIYRILTVLLFLSSSFIWADGSSIPDYILVKKSERKLYLMKDDRPIRQYHIALGKNPVGHKQYLGDNRTPEGKYFIDWRKESDKYYKSIHISYPNVRDLSSAIDRGVDPGNMIMIHGLPTGTDWIGLSIQNVDWTNGCIAVSNAAIDEIWRLVRDGTMVEIQP